jgi:predicted RecB family nuclease
MENLKASKWQLAINLVANWQNLETSLHALERVQSKGRGKAPQFIPIRFVFSNKITRDDKVLMAFDAFVLSEMLGREVSLGRLIHGDRHVKLNVRTLPLVKKVRKLIMTIEAMLSSDSPPDLVLNRHCDECEFQTLCRQRAIEKNDLSLLGGMTERNRKKFNSKGIFTITQLSYTFRPRRRGKRKPDRREKYHHALKALSIREHKIHIVGRPEPWREGKQVFIDVEGLPDRDTYYLIGVRLEASEGILQHSLWADEPDEEQRIWADFLNILSAIDKPVLVHYGRFETAFVKRMCSRYGNPPGGSQMAKALGSMVNLVSDLFARIYFPTLSNGLKEIAEYLGFTWSTPIPSGVQTIPWRYEWEATKDPSLKEIILTYNAQDCEALHIVTNWVGNLAQTFREGGGQSVKDVVDTETLKRDSPFGFKRNIFSFPELDVINRTSSQEAFREKVP